MEPATGVNAPPLSVRQLRKAYQGVVALAGVDLAVAPGETLAVLGPNGAGKTTLLSAVAGLVRPDAGEISVGGVDAVANPPAARRLLGFAPQRLGLTPTMTTRENLTFFGRLARVSPSALLSRISQVAEALALTDVLDRRAGNLSGGQQRRVHVACSLVHAPPLVLLDEPTSGVDATAPRGRVDLVRQLSSAGAAICYSTNQITDAEDLGGSVAILNRGEIVARDEVSALVAHHGRAVVEIELDADVGGPLGPSPAWSSAEVSGGRVVLTTDAPGPAIAAALAVLGGNARRLRSVDVTKAGLETVFLALTGERYSPGERAEAR